MKRYFTPRLRGPQSYLDAHAKALPRQIRRFGGSEDGSLLIFGLFCFVMMLILAGIALDLMRYEERRARLQATIDRAALAAANLRQTLDPKAVVKDYFTKAGLTPPSDDDIKVENSPYGDSRTVKIAYGEDMPTWFMNALKVPTLPVLAGGTAEESIGQVEVSLVLDVSGSMNSNSRLTNLIPAAKSFVDALFNSAQPGKLSMSIITYSTQVSAGPDLITYFNRTDEHSYSNCLEFTPEDMKTTSMDFGFDLMDRVYKRNGHFDPFYTSAPASLTNCPTATNRDILAFSGDPDLLKARIETLVASGNTSIDIGMKWGAALVDPSMQHVVTDMIGKGDLPADFGGRPYAYDTHESMKVIVVMTDGANTTEYRLKPDFDHGTSRLMRNKSYTGSDLNQYSFWDATKGQYYIPAISGWRTEPWGNGTYTSCTRKGGCKTQNDPGYDGTKAGEQAVWLSWPEVWDRMSVDYLADKIIASAYDSTTRNQWRAGTDTLTTTAIASTKDARTLDICTAAKDNDVTIFSIGFEAPTAGLNLLRSCASSPAHMYSVTGLDIAKAFEGIANSINKLRLTQ